MRRRLGLPTRRSARGIAMLAAANAPSSAESKPVSPVIAARSGRITGNGRKFRSSRMSRGKRPARRNDDLPAPDAPRMTRSRGGVVSRNPRSRSSASTIGASRPKKMPASSASSGRRPRYGGRFGSLSGGQSKKRASSPAENRPILNRRSPSALNATCDRLGRSRQRDGKVFCFSRRRDVYDLPFPRHERRQIAGGNIFDQNAKQTLAEMPS